MKNNAGRVNYQAEIGESQQLVLVQVYQKSVDLMQLKFGKMLNCNGA